MVSIFSPSSFHLLDLTKQDDPLLLHPSPPGGIGRPVAGRVVARCSRIGGSGQVSFLRHTMCQFHVDDDGYCESAIILNCNRRFQLLQR